MARAVMSYVFTLSSSFSQIRLDIEVPNDTYSSFSLLLATYLFETEQATAMAGDNSARSLLQKLIHAASTPYFGILERYFTFAKALIGLRLWSSTCCYCLYLLLLFLKRNERPETLNLRIFL